MLNLLIKILADGLVIPVIVIGACALLIGVPHKDKLEAYSRVILAGLTAYLFAKLIGSIYQPETMRPFEALGVSAGASYLNNPGFPSDHMLFCTAIVLAVWRETRYKRLTIVLAIMTVLVGVGRIVALVHTPLDVIGAVVIAMLGGVWYLQRPTKATASLSGKRNKKPV